MQDQLRISIIQTNTIWKNTSRNLLEIEKKINQTPKKTDLIILPEMFTTGFVMQPQGVAQAMDGLVVKWMKKISKEKNFAICGSVAIEEKGAYFNRFVFVNSRGEMFCYDKKHLFGPMGENEVYSSGLKRIVFEYKGWKIAPFICYDLRFPVWSRNTENYDIAIYTANWPKVRVSSWNSLLKARAIENMCYCIGVNRVGTDVNGLEYAGQSQAINSLGEIIKKASANSEAVLSVCVNKRNLIAIRKEYPFLGDRDIFKME